MNRGMGNVKKHKLEKEYRRIIGQLMFEVERERRRHVIRAVSRSKDFITLLPSAFNSSRSGTPAKIVDAYRFLREVAEKGPSSLGYFPVINGDFVLVQKGGEILVNGERMLPLNLFSVIPEVVINGSAHFSALHTLTEVECFTVGDCKINFCANLSTIKGEVLGNAVFRGCGVDSLAAGFQCGGSLNAINCFRLEVLNCETEGEVVIVRCPLRRTGRAFMAGRGLFLHNCVNSTSSERGVAISEGGLGFFKTGARNAEDRGRGDQGGSFREDDYPAGH